VSGHELRPGIPRPGVPRPGVRVGVDVGSVRVGVAASDAAAAVVLAVTTLARDLANAADLDALAVLVAERGAVEVIVGLPLGLSGTPGRAAEAAADYARALARRVAPVPVRLVDERFSTAEVIRTLQPGRGDPRSRSSRGGAGRGGAGRGGGGQGGGRRVRAPHLDSRVLRSVVDSEAAAIIVRSALAEEAATGRPAGRLVEGGPS
jgi:putative Holliday junction resolvase